jgi:EAL domain-containing protein (putative c-di-GMP-specific phosphodiesterase class I)
MVESAAEVLRKDRERFVGLAFANADLLLELDSSCCVKWARGAVRSILGIDPEGAVGQPLSNFLAQSDMVLLSSALRNLGPGDRRRDLDLRLLTKSEAGESIRSCIYRSLITDAPEYLVSALVRTGAVAETVSVRRRDRTTGLVEAVEFADSASKALERARQRGKSACVTLIQICGETELKRLLGSERAEALMAEIGSELRLHALDQDGAAKLGDGRFSIAHLEDEAPSVIAEAIVRVGDSYKISPADLKVTETTVKFHGNALAEEDVEGILSYILEKFRTDGSAGLESGSADSYLRKLTAETLSRVVMMRDVIHERRMSLHYQPIVALSDRATHHYEVLLRFADGRSPFADIQFAEQINTIHEVDLAVTRGAVARIQDAIAKRQELSLAVNMSARSLLNDNFLTLFEELAAKLGRDRSKLIVEITESAKLEDLGKASLAVDWLTRQGHPTCLDDFGAGASSLPYLQRLTVGYVKIDGAYIRGITDHHRERAIIQGVLATCNCLGIETVAEMIETEDQHKCLLDLGVHLGQGWLYGRPAAEVPVAAGRASQRVSRKLNPKDIGRLLVRSKPQ